MTTIDLDSVTLTKGKHSSRTDGLCFMEAVAWFAGEPHTSDPKCVSGMLGHIGIRLNDTLLDDVSRQQLKPLIPRLIGTADDGLDEQRACMLFDWMIRMWMPAWFELAGVTKTITNKIRELPRIVDFTDLREIGLVILRAQQEATAVLSATGWGAIQKATAGDVAAWDVIWNDFQDIGALWHDAAVWDDAAIWNDVAWRTVRAAVRAADWDTVQPTLKALRNSAITFYTQMIKPEMDI